MPGIRAIASALAAAACAAALVACGDGDEGGPIPPEQGNQLIAQLDEIEAKVQAGDCETANQLARALAANVDALPLDEGDRELRNALVRASNNLESLTEDPSECQPSGATGETDTLPTTTTPTTTTTTETTETAPAKPQDKDEDDGGPPDEPPGQGNGGGNDDDDGGTGGGDDSSGGIGSDG